jgi:hypothetical protein
MASRPELKEDDESSFCKFFRNLPEKEDTVRIFDRGDYYSAHGEDAKFIAGNVSGRAVMLRYDTHVFRSTERQPSSASWAKSRASNRLR